MSYIHTVAWLSWVTWLLQGAMLVTWLHISFLVFHGLLSSTGRKECMKKGNKIRERQLRKTADKKSRKKEGMQGRHEEGLHERKEAGLLGR